MSGERRCRADTFSLDNMTEDSLAEIQRLSRDRHIGERIMDTIAPSIYGHSDIKACLALALFGGQEKLVGSHRLRCAPAGPRSALSLRPPAAQGVSHASCRSVVLATRQHPKVWRLPPWPSVRARALECQHDSWHVWLYRMRKSTPLPAIPCMPCCCHGSAALRGVCQVRSCGPVRVAGLRVLSHACRGLWPTCCWCPGGGTNGAASCGGFG